MQDYLLTHLYWISLFASIVALVFAYVQAKKVLSADEGTDRMKQISQFVRTGASAPRRDAATSYSALPVVTA